MAITTNIQWCDSTNNLQMGCEGCELVKGKTHPTCYAKIMTDRYAGVNKGWPLSFEQPKIFPERLKPMLSWPDLNGTERKEKPWMNGLPRFIFLNDMGDTFSRGMPENWFAEYLPKLAESPHIYLVLTKWPQRFAKLSKKYNLPKNVCPGTTITSQKTIHRIDQLNEVVGGGFKWLSIEPLWSELDFSNTTLLNIDWAIFGGESGPKAQPFHLEWLQKGLHVCEEMHIQAFVKQLGSKPFFNNKPLNFKDGHAGNWNEWPLSLRIRQMPKL